MIRRAFNCAVILIAHAGKDATRGVKGSSGFEDNADVVELVEAFKPHGVIRCTVKKMRDAPDDVVTYYRVNPHGVPVPIKIAEREFNAAMGMKVTTIQDGKQSRILAAIHQRKSKDHASGLANHELAGQMTHMLGSMRQWEYNPTSLNRGDAGIDGYERWVDQFHSDLQAVRNACKPTKEWSRGYYARQTPNGGTDPELRWFDPSPEENDTEMEF
jgi:hypothetical protein